MTRRKLNTFLLLVMFGILSFTCTCYSVLSQELMISGDVAYEKFDPTLYGVLKREATHNGLAREYTGEHQDSMAGVGDKKIYHWYATNDIEGTQILDKNNVIFANHCWQMIRTTDTGGVKMIYNGEPENNQCLSTRGNHVGYGSRTSQNLASNYWYGTDYTYENGTFKVSGTTEQATWNATTRPGLIGKYTCKSTSVDGTCSTLYLVESYYNTTSAYVIPLNSSSHYSQFGTLQFNAYNNSLSYVGYMYNTSGTVYSSSSKTMTNTETLLSSLSLSTNYWYADSVIWGSPVANKYNLNNPSQVSSTTDYPNLVGKYTFRNATQTYTNTSVYYIAAVNNTTMYYISLTNSGNHTLSDFNYTYTYGDSFTDNGDGTYTINSPTTIERKDWYTNYSDVNNKYVCKNAINDTCSVLWYTTATSNTSMTYISSANNYKYAKGFIWDGSKYVLDNDTSVTFWNINDDTNVTSLNNAHYTCWNETGECAAISYIYYLSDWTPRYITFTDRGIMSIEDEINRILYNNDVNQRNSTMKNGVDAWYKHYMLDYDYILEDTIYCNDRSQSNADTNGWNPNGGSVSTLMYFKGYNVTSDLSCANTTDQFSVSNNNAKLTYKVGLMSSPEMNILNNSNARNTGQYQPYWLLSPSVVGGGMNIGVCSIVNGNIIIYTMENSAGLRPAVSLKHGTEYISGDGSMANPYVVDATPTPEPQSFSTDSWNTVVNAVRRGNTSAYHVGDTKTIDMGSLGTHTLRIANNSTPSECNNSGFSQTACGFVLEFADIINNHVMNSTDTNVGGWPASSMRTYLNSDVYNALPSELKAAIIDTTVVSGHGSTSGESNFTSTDKLYLLSTHEIWEDVDGNTSSGIDYYDTGYSNTRQLDYYVGLNITTSSYSEAKKRINGVNNYWWLRTSRSDVTSSFSDVTAGGFYGNIYADDDTVGVSPAFRIG